MNLLGDACLLSVYARNLHEDDWNLLFASSVLG